MLTPLQKLDAEHHLHPFTNHDEMHAAGTHVLMRGEGCWLHDAEGRKLFDGLAGLWCVNVGYGRKEIVDAVTRQMNELCYYPSFFNSTTEPAIRLAAKISDVAPGRLHHVLFSNSGSESNETALKLIRAYWKIKGQPNRTKIVTREFAYHGVTLATTSMTGLPSCYTPFNLPLAGFVQVPAPHPYGANREHEADVYNKWCLEQTRAIIEREDPETIGAMFVEPIQGAGGVIVPPPGYLTELRSIAREHGILFVADEVITGFGRIGDWFASSIWDLDPDLMSLAKGLTSGYLPLGASVVADDIAEVLQHGGYLAHGFTYSGHPTSCAAALANLEIIEKDGLAEKVRTDTGPYFQQKLRALVGHPAVGEVRGEQLIGAIELLPKGGKAALDPKVPLGLKGAKLAREAGVIVRGIRDLIAMAPPLIATREELDFMFAGVSHALDKIQVS